jgi:hypothetical protein
MPGHAQVQHLQGGQVAISLIPIEMLMPIELPAITPLGSFGKTARAAQVVLALATEAPVLKNHTDRQSMRRMNPKARRARASIKN